AAAASGRSAPAPQRQAVFKAWPGTDNRESFVSRRIHIAASTAKPSNTATYFTMHARPNRIPTMNARRHGRTTPVSAASAGEMAKETKGEKKSSVLAAIPPSKIE